MSHTRCITNKEYYSNALVLSQAGEPLCTLQSKRCRWYLSRGLAKEVDPPAGYPFAIQLNFKAKFQRPPKPYEIAIIENRCVICGAKKKLTMHHVVPHVIRKLFPKNEKDRSRQWCVLLCLDCHEKVELVTQAVYKKDYPKGVSAVREKSGYTLRYLKSINMIERLDLEKLTRLMNEAGYQTIAEIPMPTTAEERSSLHHLQSKLHLTAIAEWGHKFIAEHGGIEGTKAYFRELFLEFKPPYVPEGYLDL